MFLSVLNFFTHFKYTYFIVCIRSFLLSEALGSLIWLYVSADACFSVDYFHVCFTILDCELMFGMALSQGILVGLLWSCVPPDSFYIYLFPAAYKYCKLRAPFILIYWLAGHINSNPEPEPEPEQSRTSLTHIDPRPNRQTFLLSLSRFWLFHTLTEGVVWSVFLGLCKHLSFNFLPYIGWMPIEFQLLGLLQSAAPFLSPTPSPTRPAFCYFLARELGVGGGMWRPLNLNLEGNTYLSKPGGWVLCIQQLLAGPQGWSPRLLICPPLLPSLIFPLWQSCPLLSSSLYPTLAFWQQLGHFLLCVFLTPVCLLKSKCAVLHPPNHTKTEPSA